MVNLKLIFQYYTNVNKSHDVNTELVEVQLSSYYFLYVTQTEQEVTFQIYIRNNEWM